MAEIPFYLGGRPKWVSGITHSTTCEHIIKSVLNCPEFDVNLDYVLVEKWRDVEKILKPDSLILKIWNTWSEEQPNVKFTVKKKKKIMQSSEDRHIFKHKTALAKSENKNNKKIANDIETIMKKIILQGENIRAYLQAIQKEKENKVEFYPSEDIQDARGIATEEQESMENSDLDELSNVSQFEAFQQFKSLGNVQFNEWRDILEKLHCLNQLIESQEEKLLHLTAECTFYSRPISKEDNSENIMSRKLRDINAMLCKEISENEDTLGDIMRSLDLKKEFVRQLEFDVNVVEREGKRQEEIIYTPDQTSYPQSTSYPQATLYQQTPNYHVDTDSSSDTDFSSLQTSTDGGSYILDALV